MDSEKKDDVGKDSYSESQSKRQSNNSLGCLPEDVIFNILTRLPVELLHKSVRFTCKSWDAMIRGSDFVEAQLLRAKPGIFLQSKLHPFGAHFLEVKGNGEYNITALSPHFPGECLNSCDGLVLFSLRSTGDLLVVNPVTKKRLNVPKLFSSSRDLSPAAIVRVRRSGEFKLFACLVETQSEVRYSHWHVLRLGSDTTWTRFASEAVDSEFTCIPVYRGGDNLCWRSKDHINVMDVDKQTFIKFPVMPIGHHWFTQFFEIENRLAAILFVDANGYKIHKLNANFPNGKCYRQLGTFDIYCKNSRDKYGDEVPLVCEPFGVEIRQEVIFKVSIPPLKTSLYSYNVETLELKEIDVIPEGLLNGAFEKGSFEIGLHINSLVSW